MIARLNTLAANIHDQFIDGWPEGRESGAFIETLYLDLASIADTVKTSFLTSVNLPLFPLSSILSPSYLSPLCSGVSPFDPVHEHGTNPNPLHTLQVQRSMMDPFFLSMPLTGKVRRV